MVGAERAGVTDQPGRDADQPLPQGGDHGLAVADPVPEQRTLGRAAGGELEQPAGEGGGEQRTPHPRSVDLGMPRGQVAQRGVLGVTEDGSPTAVRCRYQCSTAAARSPPVTSRLVTRVTVDRAGDRQLGQFRQGQRALVGAQVRRRRPRGSADTSPPATSRRTQRISSRVAASHQFGQKPATRPWRRACRSRRSRRFRPARRAAAVAAWRPPPQQVVEHIEVVRVEPVREVEADEQHRAATLGLDRRVGPSRHIDAPQPPLPYGRVRISR